MQQAGRAGAPLCVLVALLSACSSEAPTAATAVAEPGLAAAKGGNSGNNPGHPGGRIIEKVTTPQAWGIAVRDDGLAYFTAVFEGRVGITSTRTRTVEGFIPTGDIPTGVAFSPDGGIAYVANQNATVTVIDVATHAPVATIPTNGMPGFSVQVSPDGEQLFVGGGESVVLIIDTETRQIVKSVDVGLAANAFAVAPDNRILYASSFAAGSVTEIDMFTGTVLRTFQVGGIPQGLALNRKGTRLYVGNEAGYLNDIDLVTGQIGANIPLAGGAFGVGVTPDDNQAYITIPFSGIVQVFHIQSRRLMRTIEVGGEPRRIGFSQKGRIGAVTNAAGFVTFIR